MRVLALACGVACAVVGGVFSAFSAVVLPALHRLPDADAARAMRSVNELAVRSAFVPALFTTAAAVTALGFPAVRRGDGRLVAGCAAYLLGVVVVTVVANVPLNDRLARRETGFAGFARPWARWNHVRAVAGVTAAVLLLTRP
ncbi:anthrone oxygenase family protein [Kineococcus sp. SYSU DK002]|uniref:anthrone oxygenase family protein n=1 Tax=Kineococcus sp. SYSU DK002 TaxID=3383123 RepID=UPI003D7E8FBD